MHLNMNFYQGRRRHKVCYLGNTKNLIVSLCSLIQSESMHITYHLISAK